MESAQAALWDAGRQVTRSSLLISRGREGQSKYSKLFMLARIPTEIRDTVLVLVLNADLPTE